MGLKNIFGFDERRAFEEREKSIQTFEWQLKKLVNALIPLQKTEESAQRLRMMSGAIGRSTIRAFPSSVLGAKDHFVELGSNERLVMFNPVNKKIVKVANIINLAEYYTFRNNKLTNDGKFTIIHELTHNITPNEYIADRTAVLFGLRLGVPKPTMVRNLAGRAPIIGVKRVNELLNIIEKTRGSREMGRKAKITLPPREKRLQGEKGKLIRLPVGGARQRWRRKKKSIPMPRPIHQRRRMRA